MILFEKLTRKLLKAARTGLLPLLACVSPAVAEDGYTFGVVPQFEARRLAEIWSPVLSELERRTRVEFRMVGSPRIPEFEQAFTIGEFDFSYMNPYHSLVAFTHQGYEPLVRDGDRQLFGVLVVEKDSPFQDVADLNGKKIAFPAPNALGASLLMRADLNRKHQLNFKSEFVNTHTSAYLNVVLGEADAAGGVMATFNALDPAIRDRLRIVYETTRMPPHPLVVHPRVPDEIAERVRQAIIDMAATAEGQELLSQIPIRRAVPANTSDYQMLRDLHLDDYYVDTGVK